jgi:broad specificity phosphatase PhoE
MDIDDEWDKQKWLTDAKRLVNWTRDLGKGPALLMVRHSHRLDSDNVDELKTLELTDRGHRMALAFGQRMPSDRPVRVFYSPIERTKQTAEGIVNGIRKINGNAKLEGKLYTLLGPMGDPDRFISLSLEIGFANFFNKWISGKIESSILEPLEEYTKRLVPITLGELFQANNNALHILVTHDLVIMTARFVFFGIKTDNDSLIPFLGGFGIAQKNGKYVGFENGNSRQLKICLF